MKSALFLVNALLLSRSHPNIFIWWADPLGMLLIQCSVSALVYTNITLIHITGLSPRKTSLILGSLRIHIFVCSQRTLVLLVQGQTLGSSGLWRVERMNLMFIMEPVALQLGILFPLAVHSEPQSAVLFVFWSSRNQSAGDKLHYFTFFEFSQGVLSLPLLVLALFCYFKDLLVFPRWFSLSVRDVNRNIMMFGMSWYLNIVEFILLILMFYFCSSFLCPF